MVYVYIQIHKLEKEEAKVEGVNKNNNDHRIQPDSMCWTERKREMKKIQNKNTHSKSSVWN